MTFTFIAFDPSTGALGAAVRSDTLASGSNVLHVTVSGAVVTQAWIDGEHGARIVELLAGGATPDAALADVLAGDPKAHYRQLAAVDADGRVAMHTGADCIEVAEAATGAHCSAQGNLLREPGTAQVMVDAYERSRGPLAARLLAALAAAEAAGGEVRTPGSAAVKTVGPGGVDLRVDDHPDPLGELGRLLPLPTDFAGTIVYAIVGRDETTGQLGAAMTAECPAIGAGALRVEAGVGAVATNSGRRARAVLDRIASGLDPTGALDRDPGAVCWLLTIDAQVAATSMTAAAAEVIQSRYDRSCAVLAEDVPGEGSGTAMVAAFEAASGPLADRLLAALEACAAQPGRLAGMRSAALVVAAAADALRGIDLRVDDDAAPLTELRRLLRIADAEMWLDRAIVAGRATAHCCYE